MPVEDRELRKELIELIRGGSAHADVNTILKDLPEDLRTAKPNGAPHNAWQLLEHTRIALHDLLEFCTNSKYLAPKFPDDYWPSSDTPPSAEAWDEAVTGLRGDMNAFENLIGDPAGNIYAKIPWGEGQTVFREVLLAADHTSYHLGQIVFLRKQLDAWKQYAPTSSSPPIATANDEQRFCAAPDRTPATRGPRQQYRCQAR